MSQSEQVRLNIQGGIATLSIHRPEAKNALSREIVDRVKAGWEFLLPYYDYFVTLDGDPDPSSEEIPLCSVPA